MIINAHTVVLRAIEESDLPLLYSMINDPEIERMTGGSCFPVSKDRQARWFTNYDQQKDLRCMIEIKGGGNYRNYYVNRHRLEESYRAAAPKN